MKKITCFLTLTLLSVVLVFGQTNTGTLKIFSDEPVIVYVDQAQISNYSSISLAAGTHYVKALNTNEEKVYSEIVTITENKVTTILIEAPKPEPVMAVQPQPIQTESAPPVVEAPKFDNQIYIGQVEGVLPKNMDAPFGLKFGMSHSSVDPILKQNAVKSSKDKGFADYMISTEQGYCLIESRFIDDRLFDILVAYTTDYQDNARVKVDKNTLPFEAFNKMYATIVSHYGEPLTTIRNFKEGYAEGDGKLLEALKAKKAMIYYFWLEPETNNSIALAMGYGKVPVVMMQYSSGVLTKEAKDRNLIVNDYNYGLTFDQNYYKSTDKKSKK